MHVIRTMAGAYQADGRTDAELLSHYAVTHDEAAFATLMVRHGPLVCSVCNRILGSAEDGEDAYQTVFLSLAQKAAKIKVVESLGGWLQVVARQTALSLRKKRRSRKGLEERMKAMTAAEVLKEESASETKEA